MMPILSDKQKLAFFEMLHRITVLFDDWLCDTFGFSRRPRGKHASDDT
jgi:hypothetical protein